jgi:hydroxyacylglutathione hydrolase
MLEIIRIPAFKDNYIWLLVNRKTNMAAVVDPGDANPVLEVLQNQQIKLAAILITHHHRDHSGGIAGLLEKFPVNVFGPALEVIPHCSHPLQEGDVFSLESLEAQFSVLDIPGHTKGHIAYVGNNPCHSVFCGDTLFTGGCGRLFEGTAEQMLNSLNKLKRLPKDTLVYCGHEYTLTNLKFAQTLEPENPDIQHRLQKVSELRADHQATVPSLLEIELKTNPFLRTQFPAIIRAANQFSGRSLSKESEIFMAIRTLKDNFTL